jgi:PAS domain S-box-containing protein
LFTVRAIGDRTAPHGEWMREPDPHLAHIREPRLLPHVTAAVPVWLCAENGPRILWANAAGAALLGAKANAAIGERQASAATLLASQVARLAVSLPRSGASRLEWLRGVGAGVGRAVVCTCSRLELADATAAVMVVAVGPVGPVLSLDERVRRVFAGSRAPLAIFSTEGQLIHVSAGGADRLGPAATIEALTAQEIVAEALSAGRAGGETTVGPMLFERIGSGSAIVLLATFPPLAARLGAATAAGRSESPLAIGSPRAGDSGPSEVVPLLTVVPRATNVVPFRSSAAGGDRRATLSPPEHTAFREIAKVLGAGIDQSSGERWVALPASEKPTAPTSAGGSSRSSGSGQEISAPRADAPIPSALAPGALESDGRLRTSELALRAAEASNRELQSILHTATDGVILVERQGYILFLNRSAEALFGYESAEVAGHAFVDLFAPESHRTALDYLEGLSLNGVAGVLNDGREVIGRVRQGGLIPLFMTMGRLAEGPEKFCAVFRDVTQWKRAEEELLNAKRHAERASSAKSDFLAKVSHEIRTPLNAIIGISEVMMEERFGPIGNERYRKYLKDIHTSGGHLLSLINDLLDLSKIEAGKLDLTFATVMLNELVQQCVALMQPQANRERIIIRTSLSPMLPPVVVDARSIRQIVLNLLSNSIKFTGTRGQVIVSTALTGRGEAVLRVRDTGVGMSEKEIETALEPFRQLATSTRWGSAGTGLGLPLTKALAEANRATFTIRSAVNAGTLVEIVFPATRVLAE